MLYLWEIGIGNGLLVDSVANISTEMNKLYLISIHCFHD
jgi:hypothetical protein